MRELQLQQLVFPLQGIGGSSYTIVERRSLRRQYRLLPTLPYSHCRSPRPCRASDLDAGALGHELEHDCSSTPLFGNLIIPSSTGDRAGIEPDNPALCLDGCIDCFSRAQCQIMLQVRWRDRLYSSGNWTDDPPVVHLQSWFAGAPPPQFFRLLQCHNAFWWIRDGFDEELPLRGVN